MYACLAENICSKVCKPELPTFGCFSFFFVSCFELSEGRHHYPRQPLNEASKEIHSSFIIAMTSSDQHEGTQLSIFRVNTIVVFRDQFWPCEIDYGLARSIMALRDRLRPCQKALGLARLFMALLWHRPISMKEETLHIQSKYDGGVSKPWRQNYSNIVWFLSWKGKFL